MKDIVELLNNKWPNKTAAEFKLAPQTISNIFEAGCTIQCINFCTFEKKRELTSVLGLIHIVGKC